MPRLTREYALNFYGGEPLLNFGLIKKAVSLAEKLSRDTGKRPHYSLTTNGSLITDESLRLFSRYRFALEISFDGMAQDANRKRGSSAKIVSNIGKLLDCPEIRVEVNSVFTPGSVEHLSESARFILGLGVRSVQISFSGGHRWPKESLNKLRREMAELRKVAVDDYRKTGKIRIANFTGNSRKGLFFCAAGKDRFAVTPDGGVWGCFLFPGYFRGKERNPEYRKYFFGQLGELTKNHVKIIPRVRANYAWLSVDNFSTAQGPCLFCPELEACAVCPIAAALSGSPLGKIPRDICEIQKILNRERRKFKESLAIDTIFRVAHNVASRG